MTGTKKDRKKKSEGHEGEVETPKEEYLVIDPSKSDNSEVVDEVEKGGENLRGKEGKEEEEEEIRAHHVHQIKNIKSQLTPQRCLGADDSLVTAVTMMRHLRCDQLPVFESKKHMSRLKGVITWRRIASDLVIVPRDDIKDAIVTDFMENPKIVDPIESMFDVIPHIEKHGYVLVRGEKGVGSIGGIVTSFDLDEQFRSLSKPFLLLREIEERVREIIGANFEVSIFSGDKKLKEEYKSAVTQMKKRIEQDRNPEEQKKVVVLVSKKKTRDGESTKIEPESMTFGEYMEVFENMENWDSLGLNLCGKTFIKKLDAVREIRNEVMHFSPDGIEAESVEKLERFADFLRMMQRFFEASDKAAIEAETEEKTKTHDKVLETAD